MFLFSGSGYLRSLKVASVLVFLFLFSQPCLVKAAELKFSTVLDKAEYKGQEPINATFELENKGKESVLVNKRFYIYSGSLDKQYHGEVILKVISPSGKEVSCKASYETGLPKSDYFELLQANKKVVSEYPRNLRGYFSFEEPGIYKVETLYQNVFGKEIGLDVFKDKLASKSVSFKIKE